MTYWYLNTCIYNLQSCYEASRQNKKDRKEENLDIINALILLHLLLRFMWLKTLATVWHSLLAFLLMCWYKSQIFVFLQDEFQAVLPFWWFQFTAMRLLFIWLLIIFGTLISNSNNTKRWNGWTGLEKFCEINNGVTMLIVWKIFVA